MLSASVSRRAYRTPDASSDCWTPFLPSPQAVVLPLEGRAPSRSLTNLVVYKKTYGWGLLCDYFIWENVFSHHAGHDFSVITLFTCCRNERWHESHLRLGLDIVEYICYNETVYKKWKIYLQILYNIDMCIFLLHYSDWKFWERRHKVWWRVSKQEGIHSLLFAVIEWSRRWHSPVW